MPNIFIKISSLLLLLTLGAMPGHATQVDAELRTLLKQTINQADSFEDRFDAEVWLVDMSGRLQRFIRDDKQRLSLLRAVHREATRAELQPELVLSVIQIESYFDRYALSYVGARGLMQVMPFWKKEIGRPEDNLMDIDTNLRYGCTILSYYLKKEKGDMIRALARYNGSLGKTKYPAKVLLAWEKRWYTNN
ncbi:Soluble lytic murein transglycosylase [gamma proteobacterium IMCC2047]|nr:Soluble lytic murein transglycosylase [gamma proteobacterium IMCC2047]